MPECTRCGELVELKQVAPDSHFWGWLAPTSREKPDPMYCWAVDGKFGLGRLHHVEGWPQLLRRAA